HAGHPLPRRVRVPRPAHEPHVAQGAAGGAEAPRGLRVPELPPARRADGGREPGLASVVPRPAQGRAAGGGGGPAATGGAKKSSSPRAPRGGGRRGVGCPRPITARPVLLLPDEPTGNLHS